MHPKNLSILDFTYHLPEDKIANFPLEERDESKLLVYKNGQIVQDRYRNISDFLPAGSLLVFNNTRVIAARILFKKESGGVIEVFALEPADRYANIQTAMNQQGSVYWKCLIGGASKWKHGQVLQKQLEGGKLTVTIAERLQGSFLLEFTWQPANLSFTEVLQQVGSIPIPPYLKRNAEETDKKRYQTIYANRDGSVAAPTAGLHFTENIFSSLTKKNITSAFVTLHVGAGTFMPVKSEQMEGHTMHAEFIEISNENIAGLIRGEGKIFAVGTTSLRTLESIYWMGVKCMTNPEIKYADLEIQQWEIYDSLVQDNIDSRSALQALLQWMKKNNTEKLVIKTQILIAPGYVFRMIKGLVTNFHQPQSTLLLLVAALAGEDWRKIYAYAMENDFRFLSYGDGCLLYVS